MSKQKAVGFAREGETFRLTKLYGQAINNFDDAIKADRNYAWAYAHRGAARRDMIREDGPLSVEEVKYTESKANFEKAIALRGDTYAWAKANLGYLYFKWGIVEENNRGDGTESFNNACAKFREAVQENQNYAWALAHFGQVLIHQEKYDEALEPLTKAIELAVNYAYAYALRAVAYAEIGKAATELGACKDAYQNSLNDITAALYYNPKIYESPQAQVRVTQVFTAFSQKEVQP
ncbi:MAG: hypothetical protein J7524_11150 [Roseofilum sp. Belize BBD 4]|uniref:tetratricopeptide repeat protein n=1 Tax=Roseofilum sp. Belize BBD 4 TaxID=2821500 RepID=UPI001B1CD65B|nr:hypothetical protein [Roseofilum sp. Belize BBD 4]MBP0033708.1 hypothetical protein [Roseofilum sp. Belize BBD 4]